MSYTDFLGEKTFVLTPIFANSVINISKAGNFTQVLTYEYSDEDGAYYLKINEDYDFYLQEVETIKINMQKFMDSCINYVNDEKVTPKVIEADIDFKNSRLPFFYWIIVFNGKLKTGLNVYKSDISEEKLDYNVQSIYLLEAPLVPKSVESALHYEIYEKQRFVKYFGNKGEIVGPKEILRFEYELI